MITEMQVSKAQCKQFVQAIAPSGNLFLLLTLQELRRQGLTFIAFYALQRIIKVPGISEFQLRQETGLEGYEISRACKFLSSSRLVEAAPDENDRRVRLFKPTSHGKKIHHHVLAAAATRLKEGMSLETGFHGLGENRRLEEAAESYRNGNRIFHGPLQLSFVDTNPADIKS
jgi:DNA-binding MarR family transcriptional regulator